MCKSKRRLHVRCGALVLFVCILAAEAARCVRQEQGPVLQWRLSGADGSIWYIVRKLGGHTEVLSICGWLGFKGVTVTFSTGCTCCISQECCRGFGQRGVCGLSCLLTCLAYAKLVLLLCDLCVVDIVPEPLAGSKRIAGLWLC